MTMTLERAFEVADLASPLPSMAAEALRLMRDRIRQLEGSFGVVDGAAIRALDFLRSTRVFVTSRQRIKRPEGEDLFDESIEALAHVLSVDLCALEFAAAGVAATGGGPLSDAEVEADQKREIVGFSREQIFPPERPQQASVPDGYSVELVRDGLFRISQTTGTKQSPGQSALVDRDLFPVDYGFLAALLAAAPKPEGQP